MFIVRGLFYAYFGRNNDSINAYVAFRTAPIIDSLISMTCYTIHL